MKAERRYAHEVRLKKLEELAEQKLGWAEARPEARDAWLAYLQANDYDLETVLVRAHQLAQHPPLLLESPETLAEKLATWEGESAFTPDLSSPERALVAYDAELLKTPWDPRLLVARGFFLNRLGRFAEGLAASESALRLDPGSDQAFNNRGFALTGLGRYDDALVSFAEALWLNPANASAYTNQGTTLCVQGRYTEAVAAFDQALVHNPELAAVHNNRAEALNFLGRYDEALAAADRARELAPELAGPHAVRGFSLFSLQRFADASTSFGRADRLAQLKNPVYLLLQAVALLAVGAAGTRQEGIRLLASPRLQGFQGHRLLILRTYQYLHALSRQGQLVRLAELKKLLDAGVHFPSTWQFSLEPSLTQATLSGHEDAGWLPTLIDVLLARQPSSVLESWPLWQQL
ncbi:tetratricopeptide repeat protein [Armatimonas rosea]|uniref:Tetratricopeptide (TPR) repeat protein n=1 Tax=Armatimonas rosea TaxID=685828 RepID=A0A7W9STI8_ARMRO|nr:tetratricopeptide repeat protein [Armatimonas rosea]MBB6051674.1 tetratricopeptide (TPR) repeat protein [Armatimonas rosea]